MSDYTLTQTEYRNAKMRLSRVLNKAKHYPEIRTVDDASAHRNAWQRVANECSNAAALFHRKGFPDSWHRWRNAYDDARTQLHLPELARFSCAVALAPNPFDD